MIVLYVYMEGDRRRLLWRFIISALLRLLGRLQCAVVTVRKSESSKSKLPVTY